MQNAPWWAIPLVAGAFTLAGVLLAQIVAVGIDTRRTRREDKRRWDRERQTCYVQFSQRARNIQLPFGDPFLSEETFDRFVEHSYELLSTYEELALFASPEVQDKASTLYTLTNATVKARLAHAQQHEHGAGAGDLPGATPNKVWIDAQFSFIEAVRLELGITRPTKSAAAVPLLTILAATNLFAEESSARLSRFLRQRVK